VLQGYVCFIHFACVIITWYIIFYCITSISLYSFHCTNACRTSFHFYVTHTAPHFISTPNLTCFEFPTLPGWACILQLNKPLLDSHLRVFLHLHSTAVVHIPGNILLFIARSLFCCHCNHCFVVIAFIVLLSLHSLFCCQCIHCFVVSAFIVLLLVYSLCCC